MIFDNSEDLNRFVSKKTGGLCLLAFSMGKDSIASYVELKKYFSKIIPVYFYNFPNLSFINEEIEYFEKYFNTKIIQLPHPGLYKKINSYLYQIPKNVSIINDFDLPNPTYEDFFTWIREELGLPIDTPVAMGLRRNDSPIRRMSIKIHGSYLPHLNKFYPIFDWNNKQVVDSMTGIKTPIAYKIFGKSLDGLHYQFIKPLKDNFPEDFEKIKKMFPLIELEILKYE